MDGGFGASVDGDARLDVEALEALGEEVASFAVRLDVAEHALLHKLQVFDAHEAWGPAGFLSCAQWLSWRIGLGPKAAREKVRVARALRELPSVDAAFGRGELSYSKVRALTRVATPETEQDLLDVALNATASQLERLIRSYQRCVALAEASPLAPASERRYVRRTETHGGMIKIEAVLAPEEAAVVWEAIEAASDRASAEAPSSVSAESGVEASAEAPAEASARTPLAEPTQEHRQADALVDLARAYLEHHPRTRGSGYELVLLTSRDQLNTSPGGIGGMLRDGTPVPRAMARMLACDGGCVDVSVDEDQPAYR